MTVQDQLRNDLFKYPTIMKNKWCCFFQWFILETNSLGWVDGELVEKDVDPNEPNITKISEALDYHLNKHIETFSEVIKDYTSTIYSSPNDVYALEEMNKHLLYTKRKINSIKTIIKPLVNIHIRINDFSQTDDIKNTFSKDSILLNLPDDETQIKEDWKNACIEMYDWLKNNQNLLSEKDIEYFNLIKTSWIKQQKKY